MDFDAIKFLGGAWLVNVYYAAELEMLYHKHGRTWLIIRTVRPCPPRVMHTVPLVHRRMLVALRMCVRSKVRLNY